VLEHANTPELQERCLKICEIGAQMRLLYTTALYNDYVLTDEAPAGLELAA
jgi:pyrroloquinoline-quinone synthase